MAATKATATGTAPEGLSPGQRALFYTAHVVGSQLDSEAAEVVRSHLKDLVTCKKDTSDNKLIAAFEAFHEKRDMPSLLMALDVFLGAEVTHKKYGVAAPMVHSPTAGPMATAMAEAGTLSPGGKHRMPVTLVYYAKQMASVAHELASGPAKGFVALQEIDWKRFADGFPNLFIHHIKDCRLHSVLFLASFHDMPAIMEQLAVIYALPTFSKRFSVIIPWFPTGTMERVSVIGEVATAKTLARMLSATPMAAQGPTQFSILDIHALQEQFYFSDAIHIRLKSCISILHDRLLALPDAAKVSIAFPDEGAHKRFGGKLDTFGDAVVCSKRREGEGRRIVIQEGDPVGRHCVIVDDLVQSGGTLLECAKALREAGAIAVSAYVTHAVFPNESWKKFIAPPGVQGPVDHFFITNSIPHTADLLKDMAPFEVLSIAPVVADILGL